MLVNNCLRMLLITVCIMFCILYTIHNSMYRRSFGPIFIGISYFKLRFQFNCHTDPPLNSLRYVIKFDYHALHNYSVTYFSNLELIVFIRIHIFSVLYLLTVVPLQCLLTMVCPAASAVVAFYAISAKLRCKV